MPTIKEEMAAIDRRQFGWYDNLSEDDKKKLSMWVLMRYCSSTTNKVNEINEFYLTMTNDLVNVHFNDLKKYPDLQFRLMQCVGIGLDQYHSWIKPGKRKKSNGKINDKLFSYYEKMYPELNEDELCLLVKSMSNEEIKKQLVDSGLSDKQIKEYLK